MNICKARKKYLESKHIQLLEKTGDYDNLTDRPNINYLSKSFFNELSQKYSQGTFLIIELCNLIIIENTYGHEVAATLFKSIELTLKTIAADIEAVSKGDGGGFIVFKPCLTDKNSVKLFCDDIFAIFDNPFFVGGRNIYLFISIGTATYPHDGNSLSSTLKKAALALYKAKEQDINRAVFYYKGLQDEVSRKILIYNNLRDAVYKNELEVYYQPQVDQGLSKIVKFEALLRWNNEELGNVSPAEFIPISEATGIIIELGEWILREVCKQIKEWMCKGWYYIIALNVSQKQIQSDRFVDKVISVLKEFDVPTNLIEIEVTESILMSSYEGNINTIRRLQDMGIKIALDDFGTGYSSLSYLKTIPLDTIKIDKSFIDDIVIDSVSRDIVSGIITLINKLRINITAEGVESKEQMELLRNMGCSIIQGYYYSKPLPAKAIEAMYFEF